MLAGGVMASAGLFAVGAGAGADGVPVIAAAMLLQGIGQGVFQVAYLDAVTAAMPQHNRGVAGSLGMLTRTFGLVTGATILMLIFQTFSASGAEAGSGGGGFVAGFRAAFDFAAALALTPAAVAAVRFLVRARST